MKKNGFTLAEVLVTLGIIGILSAIMVPAVGNARPDKTKLLYLKTYDSLSEILNILVMMLLFTILIILWEIKTERW